MKLHLHFVYIFHIGMVKGMEILPCRRQESNMDNILVISGARSSSGIPDSKVDGANMGPIWGRQDPGGPHVGPINLVIWDWPGVWSRNTWFCVHWKWNTLNAQQAKKPGVHLVDTTQVCFIFNEHTTNCSCFNHTCLFKMHKAYSFMWWNMYMFSFQSWELNLQFILSGLMKLSETISYCWCPIVIAMVVPLWCHTLRLKKAV